MSVAATAPERMRSPGPGHGRAARIGTIIDPSASDGLRRAANFAAAELAVAGLQIVALGPAESVSAEASVDGYVLAGVAARPPTDAPAVVLADRGRAAHRLSVSTSLVETGELAARHLLGTGRHRLVVVTDDEPDEVQCELADGFRGLVRVATSAATSPTVTVTCRTAVRGAGFSTEADAVFATSADTVADVLATLDRRRIGMRPAVAVVGFGVSSLDAARLPVPLTTVDTPSRRMGSEAARMLLAALEGRTPRTSARIIGSELTVRRSAPAAVRPRPVRVRARATRSSPIANSHTVPS